MMPSCAEHSYLIASLAGLYLSDRVALNFHFHWRIWPDDNKPTDYIYNTRKMEKENHLILLGKNRKRKSSIKRSRIPFQNEPDSSSEIITATATTTATFKLVLLFLIYYTRCVITRLTCESAVDWEQRNPHPVPPSDPSRPTGVPTTIRTAKFVLA